MPLFSYFKGGEMMPNLILNQKIKYKGKSYPVNSKGKTDPIPVDEKDVEFFEEAKMIVEAIDDEGKKLYLDERDKIIEKLKAEIEKLGAQLAKKDEIIMDLEVEVEELKGNQVQLTDEGGSGVVENNTGNKVPTDELEEKTVDELYAMAGELDISGRSKLRNDKEALLEAVKKALAEKSGE